jgi:hypothetical protein
MLRIMEGLLYIKIQENEVKLLQTLNLFPSFLSVRSAALALWHTPSFIWIKFNGAF